MCVYMQVHVSVKICMHASVWKNCSFGCCVCVCMVPLCVCVCVCVCVYIYACASVCIYIGCGSELLGVTSNK